MENNIFELTENVKVLSRSEVYSELKKIDFEIIVDISQWSSLVSVLEYEMRSQFVNQS